jgi:hypothetical protein
LIDVSEEHTASIFMAEESKEEETLFVTFLLLVGYLAYSSTVKMEEIHFSETSLSTGLHILEQYPSRGKPR